ncbi:hypothetical protein L484_015575 [Morus notabilis]|uniref:Uncharacterized protein n=1 Tax=Morus notabilis TaxID=981085 RepID=W9SDF1_9ROSA|nr:hypothetical protein L484_015575 [Morus notabilis]
MGRLFVITLEAEDEGNILRCRHCQTHVAFYETATHVVWPLILKYLEEQFLIHTLLLAHHVTQPPPSSESDPLPPPPPPETQKEDPPPAPEIVEKEDLPSEPPELEVVVKEESIPLSPALAPESKEAREKLGEFLADGSEKSKLGSEDPEEPKKISQSLILFKEEINKVVGLSDSETKALEELKHLIEQEQQKETKELSIWGVPLLKDDRTYVIEKAIPSVTMLSGSFRTRICIRKRFLIRNYGRLFLERSIRKLDFSPGGVCTIFQVNDLKNSPGPAKKELRIATKQALQLLQDNYFEFVAKQVFINVLGGILHSTL